MALALIVARASMTTPNRQHGIIEQFANGDSVDPPFTEKCSDPRVVPVVVVGRHEDLPRESLIDWHMRLTGRRLATKVRIYRVDQLVVDLARAQTSKRIGLEPG